MSRLSYRGFTLIEVLIATVLVSIILLSGMGMVNYHVQQRSWDTLFQKLERSFLDVNVYALAGFSASYASNSEEVAELPEMYHIYYEAGRDGVDLWYLETRQKDPNDPNDPATSRHITFQKYIELPVNRIILEEAVLYADHTGGVRKTGPHVLITWKNPFAQLSFHPTDTTLAKKSGDTELSEGFILPAEYSGCQSNPDECFLNLIYNREGSSIRKQLVIDLQKGVSVESL